MPHFACLRPGVWSASGYSGHGVAMAVMAGRVLAEAVGGEAGRFDLVASLPTPPFPGGAPARSMLLALAMSWYAMRDRLGI
jgi:gamma-glutamylputrescine oxidase